ncbi:MAG: L-serine ammonia-lyase [Candidatus Competibacterales bacterium]
MAISAFDLFSVGIGPSSSHTVGPMRAARRFAASLLDNHPRRGDDHPVRGLRVDLYGSLGATGKGHGTGPAVLAGLEGHDPETVDPDAVKPRAAAIQQQGQLELLGTLPVAFDPEAQLVYHRRQSLPFHPNGMIFTALDQAGDEVLQRTYYSVGGGFVVDESRSGGDAIVEDQTPQPYPFTTAVELLRHCQNHGLSISEVMLANERVWRSEAEIRRGLLHLWQVMAACVEKGLASDGILPGGLKVRRRAAAMYRRLLNRTEPDRITPSLAAMDWVNLYALAVNEENAAGGRVVTAPTNGAAGIIPAVLHYYQRFCPGASDEGIVRFFLAAAATGILFKINASISGAEVGCQGEVGSACAMAAAGLAEVSGGTPEQVENAAEIAMEHHLGLTCDPVGGLVQIPCIERNAIASVKAINAAAMALHGDGQHYVSLDKVIKTMRDTGKDMLDKYKETSRGGLAVNVIEC